MRFNNIRDPKEDDYMFLYSGNHVNDEECQSILRGLRKTVWVQFSLMVISISAFLVDFFYVATVPPIVFACIPVISYCSLIKSKKAVANEYNAFKQKSNFRDIDNLSSTCNWINRVFAGIIIGELLSTYALNVNGAYYLYTLALCPIGIMVYMGKTGTRLTKAKLSIVFIMLLCAAEVFYFSLTFSRSDDSFAVLKEKQSSGYSSPKRYSFFIEEGEKTQWLDVYGHVFDKAKVGERVIVRTYHSFTGVEITEVVLNEQRN